MNTEHGLLVDFAGRLAMSYPGSRGHRSFSALICKKCAEYVPKLSKK